MARLICRWPVKCKHCHTFLNRKSDIGMVSYSCGRRTVHIYTYIHMHTRAKGYSLHQVAFDT